MGESWRARRCTAAVGAVKRETLGYDARVADLQRLRAMWTDERRSKYLLNPGVVVPLSVDRNVWPSIFDFPGEAVGLAGQSEEQPLRLWNSPSEICTTLSRSGIVSDQYVLAAMRIYLHSDDLNDTLRLRLYDPRAETLEQDRWRAIGFDVTDGYLSSALCDLHITGIDYQPWKANWSMGVNSFALFSAFDDAQDYRGELDKRAPSHRPFYVCELLVHKDASNFFEQWSRPNR